MPVLKSGTRLKQGTFVIERELGRGGFGEVYLAEQPKMNRLVAVKVLSPTVADRPDVLERFRREALAAGAFLHPNVLPVFDFDYDPDAGAWFLAMQYVEGGRTLSDELGAPRPLAWVSGIVSALADALDTAHASGIVHRDVKPPNVLMDPRGRPLLTDFGIAHLETLTALTQAGTTVGTALYLAPEGWEGKPSGPEADQYALGVMTYEMLAGGPPFRGDQYSLALQHTSAPVPSLVIQAPGIGAAIESVVHRALSKRPGDRFASCGAFARSLADTLDAQQSPLVSQERHSDGGPGSALAASPETLIVAPTPSGSPSVPGDEPEHARPSRTRISVPRLPIALTALVVLGVALAAVAIGGAAGWLGALIAAPGDRARAPDPGELFVLPGSSSGVPLPRTVAPVVTERRTLVDSFDDLSRALLPRVSPQPDVYRLGYDAGEYLLQKLEGDDSVITVLLPSAESDASLSLDVRLPLGGDEQTAGLQCRREGGAGEQHYLFQIRPSSSEYRLDKWAQGLDIPLLDWTASPGIASGSASNHLELSCVGPTITGSANGSELFSVQDTSFREGRFAISASGPRVEARIDNLVLGPR